MSVVATAAAVRRRVIGVLVMAAAVLSGFAFAATRETEHCHRRMEPDHRSEELARRMTVLLTARGYTVVERQLEGTLCGFVDGNIIAIDTGLNARERLAVLLHERAHTILGHQESTPASEIEAESAALLVQRSLNLGGVETSLAYVAGWMPTPSDDLPSPRRIHDASSRMIAELRRP